MSHPTRNIRLTIAYDGSNYVGWQIQPNGVTVQEVTQQALRELTGEETKLIAAGRTDSGVHALGQVANFQTACTIPAEKFSSALQSRLPQDIIVRDSETNCTSIGCGMRLPPLSARTIFVASKRNFPTRRPASVPSSIYQSRPNQCGNSGQALISKRSNPFSKMRTNFSASRSQLTAFYTTWSARSREPSSMWDADDSNRAMWHA